MGARKNEQESSGDFEPDQSDNEQLKKEETKQNKPKVLKVDELEKALIEEQKKSKDYLNRLMYLQADFENYRRRTEKETPEIVERANEKLIKNLLDVIDELEIAVQSGKKTEDNEALIEGVNMVLKKLYTTLEHEGLTKIEAEGKPFDPCRHEALEKVPTKEYPEGTVIEEIRKGYMFKDKVIRPSLVKVALAQVTENKSDSLECEKNERDKNST